MRPRAQPFLWKCMSFICMRMKHNFHIKGWAPNLVLIQRRGETRKWPIVMKGSFGNKVQDKRHGRKIKLVADPGEGPVPPPPPPTPPLICRPKWGPKDRKKFFWRPGPPPYLRVWMTAPQPPSPPPPLSEGLDPPLKTTSKVTGIDWTK